MKKKVRKSFRNFILSRIAKSHKDQEFLDVSLMTSDGEMVEAHKFVLAAFCPLFNGSLNSIANFEEEPVIILPDFDIETLQSFVLLIYGHMNPNVIESSQRKSIFELCQLLGMLQSHNDLEEEEEEIIPIQKEFPFHEKKPQQQEISINHHQKNNINPAAAPPRVTTNHELISTSTTSVSGFNSSDSKFVINCQINDCPQKFTDEKDFAFHQQASHQQPLTFFCAICQKSFDKETSLRHHKIAAHHAGTKVKLECDKCGGHFTGKSALGRHSMHCDGKTTLDCNICGKIFARKDNLVNHMTRHSGVTQKCEYCHKSFRTSNDLYKHKKRLHAEESGLTSAYTINCEHCGRKFTDKGKAYQDHLNYHAGIKNYECHYCSKKFPSVASLRDHSNQHSGLSTHACKLCRKEFKRVQNIRSHLSTTHKLSNEEDIRGAIERLFLSGVDKLKALKEFEDATKAVASVVVTTTS